MSKLFSKVPTNSDKRSKHSYSNLVNGLQTTLRVAKNVAGNLGVPGLQAGISAILVIVDVAKKTSQNVQDVEKLAKHIDALCKILLNWRDGQRVSPEIVSRIENISIIWSTTAEEMKKMASRSRLERMINYNTDSQSISDHIRTISFSIERFLVETNLAIEAKVDGVGQKVDVVEGKIDQVNAKLDSQDVYPPHAISAVFDYKDRPPCLEGTRTAVLDEIYSWIGIKKLQHQDDAVLPRHEVDLAAQTTSKDRHIFWINGSAGTGKTTIAYTVADACRRHRILGASFFCSRDDADCSNPKLIFPTIAYQLGQICVPFRVEVARALTSNRDIGYSSVPYQLDELIIKPLRSIGKAFPRSVIVLDALDECKDSDTITSTILSALSRHVAELSQVKILVTSRPERRITTTFQSGDLKPATQRLDLHEIQLGVVQHDIECYLVSNLATISNYYDLGSVWPSSVDVHHLANISFGLFIYAATSIRFISDPKYSDPIGQLESLLCTATKTAANPTSPDHQLDQLYHQVLTHAFPDISPGLVARLRNVIGSIVLLQDPLSPLALARLLGLQPTGVRQTLLHLHSVIIVPEDDPKAIRLLHPSFFDFITSSTRCPNPNFFVNAQTQHTVIACACLETMKALKRDICDIKDPSLLNSEIHDLPTRIATHIPTHLQYACHHWAYHLASSTISDPLLYLVKEFSTKYLLYWVEVCSLLGDLRNALLSLNTAKQALSVTQNVEDTVELLADCEHFTREFFTVLGISSRQISHSAVLFSPRQTLLKELYCNELLSPVKVIYTGDALQETWNSCLRVMDGHSDEVKCVAFSPDGMQIVSGSTDCTLQLWDAVSGAHLNTLNGHSDLVRSVAFSPDGMRLASGSYDKTLRLWDAVSGAHLITLNGHSDLVRSIAFSPDGIHLASGSYDKTIRLWDAFNGAHINTLNGHSDSVQCVAYSPDGTRIVSGSLDDSIRLWDAVSGAYLNMLRGHSAVQSIAFSPDGMRLASGSYTTVLLWDAVSGVCLNILNGHSDWVEPVAFSTDGSRLASGSYDNTIRLWDAFSCAHLSTLSGHSSPVESVAFSPDGSHLASGSCDKTIRLWDAVSGSGDHLNQFNSHSGSINCVTFSTDGLRVASGSYQSIQLWNTVSGANIKTRNFHSDLV
ncbi:hypothetical protein BD410DRAFT_403326 [Rickenella mellea]|uniref:NACHT domain-containing protein n=1 Tax=Rickenella mellea TaxID=50990 RepID=A0A4Y7PXH3_9AGAM|nr:hypothetical protein BD410DRAFT_403326 [Rickenella mellea]